MGGFKYDVEIADFEPLDTSRLRATLKVKGQFSRYSESVGAFFSDLVPVVSSVRAVFAGLGACALGEDISREERVALMLGFGA